MRVYIIGAGPGDPGLITVRGAELIARCPVVLYTGSLVPPEVVARAQPGATVLDSSGMTLDEIVAVIERAREADHDVARVHTGDPVLFGAVAEQMRRFDALGIAYEVVPGVSSFTAAAAVLGKELTLPEVAQTVILTRAAGRTPVPAGEELASLSAHRTTMALFLSVNLLDEVVEAVVPAYGADCPVAVVHRATWPDQKVVTGTLADIVARVRAEKIRSQAMILIGRALDCHDFADSRLYDPTFQHKFRKARGAPARTRAENGATPEAVTNADVPAATSRAGSAGNGLVLVYTGQGKGKTTAALGLVMRALGRGYRVGMVQFIKGKWKTGERLFADGLQGLDLYVMGEGFTWESDDLSRDRRAAQAAWARSAELIAGGAHDVVVLDELTYAIHYGFVAEDDVLAALAARPTHVHVVITGRHAPAALCDRADLVTDMQAIKHPFQRGVRAQPGVDY